MISIPDLLDRAKKGAGVQSDYALAQAIGTSRANMSAWRNEKASPDERGIMKLCALSGDDPVELVIEIQSSRAANDDAITLWQRVGERVKATGQNVLVFGTIAMIFAAQYPTEANADATLPSLDSVVSLYIMSNVIRWFGQWLWRIGRRRWLANQSRKALSCNRAITP